MKKKEIVIDLIGLDLVKDEKDYFFITEAFLTLEKAPFWNEKYKKALFLFLHKCKQEDIAEELGVSQSTASRMLKKIFKYLKANA